MGRPSAFDRDEALQKIMMKIWRDGYEAASVKALSEMLGITRSSFYNAFSSREAMFAEVLQLYFKESPDRVLLYNAPANLKIRPLLTNFFREVCRIRASDAEAKGCLAVNCITDMSHFDEESQNNLSQTFLGGIGKLEELLKRGVESGELSADFDVATTALALKNAMIGINVLSKVVKSEDQLWQTAELSLRGLGLYSDERLEEQLEAPA